MDQFPKHTGRNQAALPGCLASAFFVHQKHIGVELAGEQYGLRFTPVERKRQFLWYRCA